LSFAKSIASESNWFIVLVSPVALLALGTLIIPLLDGREKVNVGMGEEKC